MNSKDFYNVSKNRILGKVYLDYVNNFLRLKDSQNIGIFQIQAYKLINRFRTS